MTSPNCYWDEVEKAMNQVVEWHYENIHCFLTNRKFEFYMVVKATIQAVELHLKLFSES